MGIYLNPGNENFRQILSSGIYVDKTGMISVTNKYIDTGNKYVCVSRPRRFRAFCEVLKFFKWTF